MLSKYLNLCQPLLLFLQSFLSSESFPMSQLFASSGQNIGASVLSTVLPMNFYGSFPFGLTDLISLPSKGLRRVFSSTTIQKYQYRDLWDNVKHPNIRIIGVPEEEEDKKKGHEKLLEEIIAENFPNMGKEIATQVQ